MDRLNDISYAYHYRDLDSTLHYAKRAYNLSADGDDSRAEALNNMAFVDMARMDYDDAAKKLAEIENTTDNSIEQLIAAVQQMRLCQRTSRNREFYTFHEKATKLQRRIDEESSSLDKRSRRRMIYAKSELAIVASTYYYYVGLKEQSRKAINAIQQNGDIRQDTAQYLNYLYNIGAGGIVMADSKEEISCKEFGYLVECFFTAQKSDNIFFAANALEAMAEHLLDASIRTALLDEYGPAIAAIAPGVTDEAMLAGYMADTSLTLFERYGDSYQVAGAHRTLGSCYMAINDYNSALFHLEEALADSAINRAPELVASISEQLCVAYSAIDDKASSDRNRNVYLDLQEQTRQDRSLEARADMLDRASFQLNVMIAIVVLAIVMLVFLLWLFSYLDHRQRRSKNISTLLTPLLQWQETNRRQLEEKKRQREEIAERYDESEQRRQQQERRNMDSHAKVTLANSVMPLIDRMLNEVERLSRKNESEEVRNERYAYISELTDKINQWNDVLTQWIQLRQGMLNLHIETFPLAPLFDIVAKGRTAYRIKGIELDVKPTTAAVKADRILTLFMVNTLADNARKATEAGGRVTISATETADYVEISVKDTGRGLSPDKLATVFSRNISGGHGFGLLNCRGIIEKYRKTSRQFSSCLLSAESEEGHGSRFFFRLPRGVAKTLTAIAILFVQNSLPSFGQKMVTDTASNLSRAAVFADSAYFSNIAGTYVKTLDFADSCRHYLNHHYLATHPRSSTLMVANGETAIVPAEIAWFRDSVRTNYNLILDIRNESAVAALALHEWTLYDYNNNVYTQLFKEMSADNTLGDYCRVMQQSQASKTIAITLCVIVLLLILPAYYVLYYRHRLYYRFCVERIDAVNAIVLSDLTPAEKLMRVEPCLSDDYPDELKSVVERIVEALREAVATHEHSNADLDTANDELQRSEHEGNSLYVCNAVLDNCLSTLKHETMYYPSRIRQLVDSDKQNTSDLRETVAYYRELCYMLSLQASRQLENVPVKMSLLRASDIVEGAPHDVTIIGNRNLLTYLFDLLKRQDSKAVIEYVDKQADNRYATFQVSLHVTTNTSNLFVPATENIPYLVCRQIVREHSEATDRRGCGVNATTTDGTIRLTITLPRKESS